MASLIELEKLYHIQRAFISEHSLESTVASERVDSLIQKTEQLIRQRAFLRDERRRLRIATEHVEETKRALLRMRRSDFFPQSPLAPSTATQSSHPVDLTTRIRINIGGLMFESTIAILKRDPHSLLARLCDKENSPMVPSAEGIFFFDRDWWLFRYIITFLRDGTLPDDRKVLAQLYREASFWQLRQLQLAIEEQKLNLRSAPSGSSIGASIAAGTGSNKATNANIAAKGVSEGSSSAQSEAVKPSGSGSSGLTQAASHSSASSAIPDPWWRKLPSWTRAIEEEEKRKDQEAKKKKEDEAKKYDWWTSTTYKGKKYLPLPADTLTPSSSNSAGQGPALAQQKRGEDELLRMSSVLGRGLDGRGGNGDKVGSGKPGVAGTGGAGMGTAPPHFNATWAVPPVTYDGSSMYHYHTSSSGRDDRHPHLYHTRNSFESTSAMWQQPRGPF